MTKRTILIHPDPRLKKTADPVTEFGPALERLAEDMLETMYDAPGIGLAAPQIGKSLRIFVMDCASRDGEEPEPARPLALINPEILWCSEDTGIYEEGCLSIPDIYAEVRRPKSVQMRWFDPKGNVQEEQFDGLWATCAQHELDHLNGKLFIDYLSGVKRTMITAKMKKLKRDRERG